MPTDRGHQNSVVTAQVAALPEQWLARFGYRPLLAETFTDPEAHAGTCYKAAGWQPVGSSTDFQRSHRCDYFLHHGRPKRIWLKPLHPRALQWLGAAHLPPDCHAALTEGADVRCATPTGPVRWRCCGQRCWRW